MDLQKAFDDCFDAVKGYVDRSLTSLHKRIDAIEKRTPERGEKGDPGPSGENGIGVADALIDREGALVVTLSDGRTKSLGVVVGLNGKDGSTGRDGTDGADGNNGIDGKDGEPGLPGKDGIDGKDGRDGVDGKDGTPGLDGPAGPAGDTGNDGKDGSLGEPGNDGKDGVDGKDGQPGLPGQKGLDGRDGLDGKDGINGKDGLDAVSFLRDANGHLVATMSDGTTKDLGLVDGKDGAAGLNGKDGSAGRDGLDGFGFDDLTVEYDGERGFAFKFIKGERTKEFRFSIPVVLDKGVYKDDTAYEIGDAVTYGGAYWICQDNVKAAPGLPDSGWRLAVKRGRDGKDGIVRELPAVKRVKSE
jgi:hypothetical protein